MKKLLTRSHRICSIAIVELSLLLTNRLFVDPVNNIIILAATAIGATLPDIDEYNSAASKKSVINFSLFLKHRGITHSFLGWAIFSGGLYYLMNKFIPIKIDNLASQNYWSAIWFGLVIGYFLHLVEDSFSKQGVEWLAPFYKKKSPIYYKVGGCFENFLTILSYLAVVMMTFYWIVLTLTPATQVFLF